MKLLEIGRIQFHTAEPLTFNQSHLFRGCIARRFSQYELVHNHSLQDDQCKYRYPLIQYKILNQVAVIVGIGEQAIRILEEIFCQVKELTLGENTIPVEKRSMEVSKEPFGMASEPRRYLLATPWIALDSENYSEYKESSRQEQDEILQSSLIGNLIRLSKGMNYHVPEQIYVSYQLNSQPIVLKGKTLLGFQGPFESNFFIPDFLGIGKSCSRGYGCCLNLTP